MKNILIFFFIALPVLGQTLTVADKYLTFNARQNDPLYTTYTAAIERSRLYGDKGYKMDYYSEHSPVTYSGDQAGRFYNIWKVDQVVIINTGEFYEKPVITSSFPDMAIMEYSPFKGIKVQETFFVYSSSVALVNLQIRNTDKINHNIELYPILELGNDSLMINDFDKEHNGYITEHRE
ncbi:MAG: hypothetical protein WC061_07940, partial [Melioribacteraceae bacterium]